MTAQTLRRWPIAVPVEVGGLYEAHTFPLAEGYRPYRLESDESLTILCADGEEVRGRSGSLAAEAAEIGPFRRIYPAAEVDAVIADEPSAEPEPQTDPEPLADWEKELLGPPTSPGIYSDRDGDLWAVRSNGDRYLLTDSSSALAPDPESFATPYRAAPDRYAPFTLILPLP